MNKSVSSFMIDTSAFSLISIIQPVTFLVLFVVYSVGSYWSGNKYCALKETTHRDLSVKIEYMKPLDSRECLYSSMFLWRNKQAQENCRYVLVCNSVWSKKRRKLETDNGAENSADNTLWILDSWLSWKQKHILIIRTFGQEKLKELK